MKERKFKFQSQKKPNRQRKFLISKYTCSRCVWLTSNDEYCNHFEFKVNEIQKFLRWRSKRTNNKKENFVLCFFLVVLLVTARGSATEKKSQNFVYFAWRPQFFLSETLLILLQNLPFEPFCNKKFLHLEENNFTKNLKTIRFQIRRPKLKLKINFAAKSR